MMHPTVGVTVVSLAGAMALMVFGWGWGSMTALFVVGAVFLVLWAVGLTIVLALCSDQQRRRFLRAVAVTTRADLSALQQVLRGRRNV